MASIYVDLHADDTAINGEPSTQNLGGVDVSEFIEALSFYHEASVSTEANSSRASGTRQHSPLTIVKYVDKGSPLLMQALAQNQSITATFKFFRANNTSGVDEHYYSITGTNGRIVSIREESANALYADGSGEQFLERVSIVFYTIAWTHETESQEFEDNWQSVA